MPWLAEEMLDAQHQRVDIPAHARTVHKGLLRKRLEEDLCWIIPPPNNPIGQGTEQNMSQNMSKEGWSLEYSVGIVRVIKRHSLQTSLTSHSLLIVQWLKLSAGHCLYPCISTHWGPILCVALHLSWCRTLLSDSHLSCCINTLCRAECAAWSIQVFIFR